MADENVYEFGLAEILDYITATRKTTAADDAEALFIYHTCVQEDLGLADINAIKRIIMGEIRTEVKSIETANLYEAYAHLKKLQQLDADRLLEVDFCVLTTHKLLMKNLPTKTPGGQFSASIRQTTDADGAIHRYPTFETPDSARTAVVQLLDQYNSMWVRAKSQEAQDERAFVWNGLKCAAWLFHRLLTIHPFGDGNGRLCRLLLNHVVSGIVSVPVSLRGTRENYLRALTATPGEAAPPPRLLLELLVRSVHSGLVPELAVKG